MKTTTRILIALLLVLSLLCAFCVFVSAEGEDENAPEPEIAVSEENGASEGVEKQGFADALWDFVGDNADTIFSGIALAGIGTLLFLWKKGLIPIVSGVLAKISKSVTDTSSSLEDKSDEMSQTLLGFLKQVEPYLPMLKDLTESLHSVKAEKDAQLIINKGVFDLLGMIIETARIPDSVKEQYRLEKVKAEKAMMEIEAGDSE